MSSASLAKEYEYLSFNLQYLAQHLEPAQAHCQ